MCSEKVFCGFGVQTSEERVLTGDIFGVKGGWHEGEVEWNAVKLIQQLVGKLQTGFNCCHKTIRLASGGGS